MKTLIKKAALSVALAATALTAAAPADAQRYRGSRGYHGGYGGGYGGGYRHYNRGGNAAAGALLGGIVGLGLGAAIASNNRDRYYDGGYYNVPPRVVYRDRYYAPPPPPRVIYREREYVPSYGYGGYGGYGY